MSPAIESLADRSEVQPKVESVTLSVSLADSEGSKEGFTLASGDGFIQIACQRSKALLADDFSVKPSSTRLLPARLLDRIAGLSSVDESRLKVSTVMRVTRGERELRVDIRRDTRLDRWILRMEEQTPDDRRRAEAETFSPRLKGVLHLLLKGQPEKEIAHELGLAAPTVHDYVKQIFRRLGVHSRSELMALWRRE